jgi:hypothetical protein
MHEKANGLQMVLKPEGRRAVVQWASLWGRLARLLLELQPHRQATLLTPLPERSPTVHFIPPYVVLIILVSHHKQQTSISLLLQILLYLKLFRVLEPINNVFFATTVVFILCIMMKTTSSGTKYLSICMFIQIKQASLFKKLSTVNSEIYRKSELTLYWRSPLTKETQWRDI